MDTILNKIKNLVLTLPPTNTTVVKKEDNCLEADFFDSTINEHYHDYNITYEHSKQLSNHLPTHFFDNPDKLYYYLFLGLYGGDGRNKASHGVIGFTFRSTEFAFLFEFLVCCGVRQPKLAFYANYSKEPDRFRAGYHAGVRWEYLSILIEILRELYGFPSSKLYESDRNKLDTFLVDDNENYIVIFFLGWFMADGTIKWNWSGDVQNKRIKYISAEVSSKDEYMMIWFQKRLVGIETEVYKDSKQQSILRILKSKSNRIAILDAIKRVRLENIPMNGKLLWWEKFLQSKDGMLSEDTAPPRSISFFQYLGQDAILHSPLACLIGQDFYALNLCQLNKILLFCKYPGGVLKSTYALDIMDFTCFALDLEYREKLTVEQLVFVNYVQCCKKRLTSKFRLTDFQYKQAFFECEVCQQVFLQLVNLNRHLLLQHDYDVPDDRFECSVCKKKINTISSLKSHIKYIHEYDGSTFDCDAQECSKKYKYKNSLLQHQILKHGPDGPLYFSCKEINCEKRYESRSGLRNHQKYVHENQPRPVYPCGLNNCTKEFLDQKSWLWHIYTNHLDD